MPEDVKQALRAMWWGSLAGGGVFLLLTVPIGIAILLGDGEPAGIIMAIIPLLMAAAGVVPTFLLIGLPLTHLFHRLRCERAGIYVVSGLIAGVLAPITACAIYGGTDSAATGVFLAVFGAFAGAVAGNVWGEWREILNARACHDEAALRPRSGPEKFLS